MTTTMMRSVVVSMCNSYSAAFCISRAPCDTLQGTSNNCRGLSGTPNLPANDSALFSFRFCTVHPKDVRDCQLRQLFEAPTLTNVPDRILFRRYEWNVHRRRFLPSRSPVFFRCESGVSDRHGRSVGAAQR